MNLAANFGNWVSTRIILAPTIIGALLVVSCVLSSFFLVPAALFLGLAGYFGYARFLFSPDGADVQNKIRTLVLNGLRWDGNGRALDIGCGNGGLAIGIAKMFPQAHVVGIDSWGPNWEYSQRACENNARVEHIDDRVTFQRASASSLPFPDGAFDAVVSNLVFHEVKDRQDKTALIREALRVLKPGGRFALQDLYYLKRLYGNPGDLVKTVRDWGVKEVAFIPTKDSVFIPWALKLPFMLGALGLLKGEK